MDANGDGYTDLLFISSSEVKLALADVNQSKIVSTNGVNFENSEIVEEFSIHQNYPNPFNPSTKISYAIPENSQVKIRVYNLLGQEVATLINSVKGVGNHTISFDASNLNSGFYIARIEAVGNSGKTFSENIKMQLIK